MDEIKVINLDEVVELLGNKVLSDKDFSKSDLLNAKVDKPIALDDVSFAFAASGSFSIQLFNSPDDLDEAGVVGTTDAALIKFAPDKSWLKYQIRSDLKASGGVDLSSLGFDITGEKSIIFTSYRLHKDLAETIRNATLQNFNPYLFLANASHPGKLEPGEVLAMQLPGKVNMSVSVSWADIFTGNLSLFQQFLKPGEVVNLEIGAKAEVDFTVELQDDFSLKIRRNDVDSFAVFLHKTTSRKLGGMVSASIGVAFKDPDAVEKVLGTVVEGLMTDVKGKVQPILDKNPLNNLTAAEKAIVLDIAKALGFDPALIKTVGDFQTSVKKTVGKVIEDIATAKVRLGFAYEYNRIDTTDTVLEAELTGKALNTYHSSLIRFKLNGFRNNPGLLSDFRKAEQAGQTLDGVTIQNYLNEQKTVQTQAWGFSLGIGKWTLEGKDNKEITEVVRENLQGNRQVAFKGVRGYNGNFFGSENNWRVDFNAEMDRFSQKPIPLVNELKYSLFLLSEWKKPKSFTKESIRHIIDQAILWQVLPQEQFDATQAQLIDLLNNKDAKSINASIHLKISPDVFSELMVIIGSLIQNKPLINANRMALSLAAAMSYRKDFRVRNNVQLRTDVYGPLWAACLIKSNTVENNSIVEQAERNALGFAASDRLKQQNEGLMAAAEIDPDLSHLPNEDLFTSTLALNANVRVDWSAFRSGFVALSNGFNLGLIYEDVVKKAFRQMQAFWSQEHYVRALGHYFLSFATSDLQKEGINRSLTISYTLNNEPKVINIVGKLP